MGLGSSKAKRPNPDDLETNMAKPEPLARHQQTQARTAASSSQPEKKRTVEKGVVPLAYTVEPQKICKDGEKIPPRIRRPRKSTTPKQLFLELDRKRKAPVGLSSLAINCVGPSSSVPKRYKPCDKVRPAQDNGTGLAMVGIRVRRGTYKGRITGYNHSSKLYQVKYLQGKEEAFEWHNLKPCLVESDNEEPYNTASSTSQRSLLSNSRWRRVNDLVYGNRPAAHHKLTRKRHNSSRM